MAKTDETNWQQLQRPAGTPAQCTWMWPPLERCLVAVLVALILAGTAAATGRVAVQLRVRVPPGTPPADKIYLAGDAAALGRWQPDGIPLERESDGCHAARIMLPIGSHVQFKVTRGSWQSVETDKAGGDIANRRLLVDGVATIEIEVAGWAAAAASAPNSARPRTGPQSSAHVPDWAADAVFYQIFPERFRNGDPSNDPTQAALEFPEVVPSSWAISTWTGDWYARAPWERALGDSFYEDGVFHRRYGGDLQGVLDKLDYLADLGINAIYFNPVFYARSLHKYDGNTFHHVDPYFGPDPEGDLARMANETSDPATWQWTRADRLFLRLIASAHARGIRIIMDGVFNHTGRDFFAFADLRARQQRSPYKTWYVVERFDDPQTPAREFAYGGWWGIDTLPEFANNADGTDLHPGPKKYIFDATARWMDPDGDGRPTDGTDGWRLDVANEVPDQFWVDWNRHVRRLNPEAYTVCEIWEDAGAYLERTGFSASMNYHGFAFLVKGFLVDGAMRPSQFAAELDARRKQYPPRVQLALQNLIDSHDTDRLASMIVNAGREPYEQPHRFDYDVGSRASPRHDDRYDVRKPNRRQRQIQRLVALMQMTYPGAPMIYYGTETGMWGGDDPDDRMPMVWPDLTYEPQAADPLGRPRSADDVVFDRELFDYYRRLIRLRRRHAPLRRGRFHVQMTDDNAGTMAFSRELQDEALLVVLNRSDRPQTVRIPGTGMATGHDRRFAADFVSTGRLDTVRVRTVGTGVEVEVPALAGVVLRCVNPEP